MNFNQEGGRDKLLKAVKNSSDSLKPFREMRKKFIRDYTGTHYCSGTNTTSDLEVISNLMYQTAETYSMSLSANRPRILVTSKYPELSWFAHTFQQATNNLIKEIQ